MNPVAAALRINVEYDLKKPCGDCPFLKTTPFHVGVAANFEGYMESMSRQEFAHTYHKTDNRDEVDGPRNHQGPTQHCVGALLMLLKSESESESVAYWTQDAILYGIRSKKLTDDHLRHLIKLAKERDDVFTLIEMIRFYYQGMETEMIRTTYVDAVNGDDATARVGDQSKPFASIGAAQGQLSSCIDTVRESAGNPQCPTITGNESASSESTPV